MRKKPKSLFDREMEKASFKRLYEKEKEAFGLEVQILKALEEKDLTYDDFAKMIGTQKANISRDLKSGGLSNATLSRISKMADALKMVFIPVLLPKSGGNRKAKISQVLRILEAN
jgi:Trp operon repressor